MKVIKQISENEFVIKMDDCDLQMERSMKVAHDYVEFAGNSGITTEGDVTVTGKFASCSNWIKRYTSIHIPIREIIKIVLPYLNNHEYCKSEHLITSSGKPNYCWNNDVIFFKDLNNKDMVAVRLVDEEEYTIIPRKIYAYLIKGNINV